MIKKVKMKVQALAVLMVMPFLSQAQYDNSALTDARDFVFENAPIVLGIIFLAGAVVNIGKVWGSDPDWKAFFKSLLIFVIAASALVGIVSFVTTLSFR